MSIFTRPDSPPPRQPSPDFVPAPLPSPHLRARLHKSSSKQSLSNYSPSVPPGLHPSLAPHNFVRSTRSCEHLNEGRKRTSSTPILSPIPRSLPQLAIPSTSLSVDHGRPNRRFLSHATPYRSPPPSPTIHSPPPPVPPIPPFVIATTKYKPTHTPQPMSTPIHIPDFGYVSPLPESTSLPQQNPKVHPSPQKHSAVRMTCLKFFSLRSTKQRLTRITQ